MFSLSPSRWLYAVYMTPALVGLRFAYVYQDPTFNLIGALMAASTFVMIGENAWSVAKREHPVDSTVLRSEAELAAIGRAAYEAKQPKEQHPGDAWKDKGIQTGSKPLDLVYNQTMKPVRIDNERVLAKTLVTQYTEGLKVDMTESYWIAGGHWQASRDDLMAVFYKWNYYNIAGKKRDTKTSTREVWNWDAMMKIAEGRLKLPLPQQ